MAKVRRNRANWRIESSREVETIYSHQPVLNEAWTHTDCKGHEHYVDKVARGAARLPTLRWKVDIPGSDEYPEQGHWECRRCREHIVPGSYIPMGPIHIPGMTTHILVVDHVDNGWLMTSRLHVTKDEALAIAAGDLKPESLLTEDRILSQTGRTVDAP